MSEPLPLVPMCARQRGKGCGWGLGTTNLRLSKTSRPPRTKEDLLAALAGRTQLLPINDIHMSEYLSAKTSP
jgi:hypothetical protein